MHRIARIMPNAIAHGRAVCTIGLQQSRLRILRSRRVVEGRVSVRGGRAANRQNVDVEHGVEAKGQPGRHASIIPKRIDKTGQDSRPIATISAGRGGDRRPPRSRSGAYQGSCVRGGGLMCSLYTRLSRSPKTIAECVMAAVWPVNAYCGLTAARAGKFTEGPSQATTSHGGRGEMSSHRHGGHLPHPNSCLPVSQPERLQTCRYLYMTPPTLQEYPDGRRVYRLQSERHVPR